MKYAIVLFIWLAGGLTALLAQKGIGEFENEIRIGSKTSADADSAGMIQYLNGDFQGYDGVVWRSFLEKGVNYAHVFTVAESGGDFDSIQPAIAACGMTSLSNPCLVRVMPGVYMEDTIRTKPWLHLQGAGKYNTRIDGRVITTDRCVVDGFTIMKGVMCDGTSPKITNNIIRNPDGSGILVIGLDSSATPWIKQNEIRHCTGYGVECVGGPTFPQFANPWIIINKIDSNDLGGILCLDNAWPTISNNQIRDNYRTGIELHGIAFPTEPTISDNVISGTKDMGPQIGTGIFMINLAEPRIMSNDIYTNRIGIDVLPSSQPSIQANNINYNDTIGIRCSSTGAGVKKVVIIGNHIHSNGFYGLAVVAGGDPVVTHNQISHHLTGLFTVGSVPQIAHNSIVNNASDIFYPGPPFPVVSLNVFDSAPGLAPGMYNVDQTGSMISP